MESMEHEHNIEDEFPFEHGSFPLPWLNFVPFTRSGYEARIFLNLDDLLWCCFQIDVSFIHETMRFELSFWRAAKEKMFITFPECRDQERRA